MSQENHEGPSESGETEEQQYERAMERRMRDVSRTMSSEQWLLEYAATKRPTARLQLATREDRRQCILLRSAWVVWDREKALRDANA